MRRNNPLVVGEALAGLPKRQPTDTISIQFTQKEIELLWLVLGNGAPEDGNSLGMSDAEIRTFEEAANRLADAGHIPGIRL